MKVKTNIELTFTKLFSFLILTIGTIFAFIYKDPQVMMFALGLASGLAGLKNYSDMRIRSRELEYGKKSVDNPEEEQ